MMDEVVPGRMVVFEFVGGPHDGLVVRDVIGPNYDEADGLLWRADGGRPGTKFCMPTEYALATLRTVGPQCLEQLSCQGFRFLVHWYEVIARRFGHEAIQIRVRHVGASE